MKAAVWNGPHDLAVKEVPEPHPSKGEVLIKTKAVGICGTDLEIYDGRFKWSEPPLIIGHEGGGVIEAVGADVSKLKKGDRVIVECLLHCGECEYCRGGRYGLCDNGGVLGMIGAQGEYAEYFLAPEENCYLLPEKITWPEAALIDTLAGPIHGFNQIHIASDSTVAVFGPGPAGLFFCKLAKLRGASRVYLIGTRDERLAMGREYGADLCLHVRRDSVEERIRQETSGRGVDIAVEVAGSEKALSEGLRVLKKGGVLLIYGVFGGGPVPVDVQLIQQFEFSVFGSCGLDYSASIKLIESGQVAVKDLVSHTFTLHELVEAFSNGFIQERRNNYMKGVVVFE
jgi:2-desacetyl-2-hydroxyethyl bacteriochlorophyllide A dehydrogenase